MIKGFKNEEWNHMLFIYKGIPNYEQASEANNQSVCEKTTSHLWWTQGTWMTPFFNPIST